MPVASWLFVRNNDSIWIERPSGHLMIVAGPGSSRVQHDFPDEAALEAYQVELAERLTAAGWFLWGVNRERRQTDDLRSSQRGTPDRRAPNAAS